jgi:hypothetical protein
LDTPEAEEARQDLGVHVPREVGGGDRARMDRIGGDAVATPAACRLYSELGIGGASGSTPPRAAVDHAPGRQELKRKGG